MTPFPTLTMAMAAGALVLASTAVAGPAQNCDDMRSDTRALLEETRDDLAWEARNTRGIERFTLTEDERRVQEMIDSLQRGQNVDTAEIDVSISTADGRIVRVANNAWPGRTLGVRTTPFS